MSSSQFFRKVKSSILESLSGKLSPNNLTLEERVENKALFWATLAASAKISYCAAATVFADHYAVYGNPPEILSYLFYLAIQGTHHIKHFFTGNPYIESKDIIIAGIPVSLAYGSLAYVANKWWNKIRLKKQPEH